MSTKWLETMEVGVSQDGGWCVALPVSVQFHGDPVASGARVAPAVVVSVQVGTGASSYFVSLRTVEVPPFNDAETRLLLTEALRESPLFEPGDARSRGEQAPPADEAIFQSPRRRQLVEEEGGPWRLRVPLMQRWLRQRS